MKQRHKEKLNATLASGKLFNGARHGAEALIEIQFLTFYSIFIIFLILYH
jgi:hypothetical protein